MDRVLLGDQTARKVRCAEAAMDVGSTSFLQQQDMDLLGRAHHVEMLEFSTRRDSSFLIDRDKFDNSGGPKRIVSLKRRWLRDTP